MPKKKKIYIDPKYQKNLQMDIYQLVWDLTAQVPKGRVTTYGAIARALGDIRASRAIGVIEHVNPRPIVVPCHRVVYSNGGIGGFGAPEGVKKKIELLGSEGVKVKDDKIVNFNEVLFENFKTPKEKPLERLRNEQRALRSKIDLQDKIPFDEIQTVAGIDVSYTAERAFGAVVLLEFGTLKLIEKQTIQMETHFPYISTYLSYHELPISIELLQKLSRAPDVIIFDGNGILHPLNMGLATHAGIIFDMPTVGIAKKRLLGKFGKPIHGNKLIQEIVHENKLLGYGLCSWKNLKHGRGSSKSKPVYVSPGNNISFESARKIAQKICIHRIPEPIRLTHTFALEQRRQSS